MKIKLLFILFFLIKISLFSQVWEKIYYNKTASTFTQTPDNKYILAGSKYESMMQEWNVFKTDSIGISEWDTTFTFGSYGVPACIQLLTDSNYIIVGHNNGQIYTMKYNKNNQLISESSFGINNGFVESVTSITNTNNDSTFLITGNISTSNDPGLLIAKINNNGDSIWSKIYYHDYSSSLTSISKINDSSYFCVGTNVDTQIWLFKINEFGDTLWTKSLDNSSYDRPASIIKTNDNNFLINGTTNYGHNLLFMKIDQDGNKLWTKVYDSNYDDNWSISIANTFDNGYISANKMYDSATHQYTWIMKLNNVGDSIWSIKTTSEIIPNKIIQTDDSLFVCLANSSYNTPRLIKLDSLSASIITNINNKKISEKIFNYPNPFNNGTVIVWEKNKKATLTINDIFGNIILVTEITNDNKYYFRKSNIKSGIYFYTLKIDNKILNGKMIKI